MTRPTFGEWIADKQRELYLDRNGDPIPAFEGSSLAPVELIVKRYRCAWCPKSWSRRATTVAHMKICWSDPAKKSCRTCAHFERARPTTRFDPYEPPDESVDECALDVELPERAPVVGCPLWEAVSAR